MSLTILQAQTLINRFNHLNINHQVHMAAVNYALIPFEGNINPGDPKGIKLYIQAAKDIYKGTDKLYISVSNTKDILYHFLSLPNKYGCGCLTFLVGTATGARNTFRVVEQIQLAEINKSSSWIFWTARNWKCYFSSSENFYSVTLYPIILRPCNSSNWNTK